MKVASKTLIMELLEQGYILEFDFHTKCYLCDSKYNRLYAVQFDTYISLVPAMEKFHRNKQYSMTDSNYYRLTTTIIKDKNYYDDKDREYHRKEIIEMVKKEDDINDLHFLCNLMSLYFYTKRKQGSTYGSVGQERAIQYDKY